MNAQSIRIRGRVQGVGFRPLVWRAARERGLRGEVRNDADGVLIHLAGPSGAIDEFLADIQRRLPRLARIDAIERARLKAGDLPAGFRIAVSGPDGSRTGVTPDAAICPDCAREVADPAERRYRYPFANCTQCGPRFSIVEGLPYDRAKTSMAAFAPCDACRAEFENPVDRRFHAQPIACGACGPRVWLERDGQEGPGDPIDAAADLLGRGGIVAIKGIGGFHLACDAANETAVARLRARKRRPTKPFALMAPDVETVRSYARLDEAGEAALGDAAAPILLLDKHGAGLAPSVAPGQWTLGWMLPATPLHLLVLRAVAHPLVMTSGNRAGEPQAMGNAEARATLASVADAFLMHDREIVRRLDDSVLQEAGGAVRVLRRGRGIAPGGIARPDAPGGHLRVTAYGAQVKSAICLLRPGEAILSQHIGDLEAALAMQAFRQADADYHDLFRHRPDVLAADLHPDFQSTRYAQARSAALGVPLVRVQHHHAHVAACMAENGWRGADGPVVGIVLDGLGLGPDGTIWGGEILVADYGGFRRHAYLKPVPLPGGAMAQMEPWRALWAHLTAAGIDPAPYLPGRPLATLRAMVDTGVNAPRGSAAGRLYDAVCAALGLAPERQSHEAEAAMRLETLARGAAADTPGYPFARDGREIDPAPMWRSLLGDIAGGRPVPACAAAFEAGLADAMSAAARAAMARTGAGAVALTGGCFQNAGLLRRCLERLAGVKVLTHRDVPANDGGVALGQALVAAARLGERTGWNRSH